MISIQDSRKVFKSATFSNFKKKDVCKNLTLAIYYGKHEESFFWTCELLCTNLLIDLWNVYFTLMSKYIHAYNPKLPLFIHKKYQDFKELTSKYEDDLQLRNDGNIRILFGSITLVLCESQKYTILDDLTYKFDFKIENLYENLKAPNVQYIEYIWLPHDPKEYVIPFNELIYHLQVTKQKTDIHFWINWIIQYDALCRKKKKIILCYPRKMYSNKNDKLSNNIIWIIWDILIKLSKESPHQILNNIVVVICELFSTRYAISCNKSRIHMIYHCIELLLLNQTIDFTMDILKQKNTLSNLEENLNVVFEQIKKHEINEPIEVHQTKLEKKMDLYKNVYNNLLT